MRRKRSRLIRGRLLLFGRNRLRMLLRILALGILILLGLPKTYTEQKCQYGNNDFIVSVHVVCDIQKNRATPSEQDHTLFRQTGCTAKYATSSTTIL